MKKSQGSKKNPSFIVFLKKRAIAPVKRETADEVAWSDFKVHAVFDKKRHALCFPAGCDVSLSKGKTIIKVVMKKEAFFFFLNDVRKMEVKKGRNPTLRPGR